MKTSGSSSKDRVPIQAVITDKQSTHEVIQNDLLIKILLLLPVISLFQLKSVCKRWLSIISDSTFTLRRSQIPTLDPPCGAVNGSHALAYSAKYHFLSFNSAPKSNFYPRPVTFRSKIDGVKILIMQSCNGLFLCCTKTKDSEYYVYNPSTNLIKRIPQYSINDKNCGARIAFDPTKSPHYKVIRALFLFLNGDDDSYSVQIQTYSSETNMWSECTCRCPRYSFSTFYDGIYWNDALYWLYNDNVLYINKLEQETLQTIKTPCTDLYQNFKLFETRGYLLLLCTKYGNKPLLMDVYEMRKGYSEWVVKYRVNLNDDVSGPRRSWVYPVVYNIVLREREEDSFILFQDREKLFQYKPVLKTSHELYDLESVEDCCFQFIPSFAGVGL